MQYEKGVPIPKIVRYKFEEMEVGDSRFFEDFESAEKMANAGYGYAKSHPGFRVMRRKVEGGFRVWRVS